MRAIELLNGITTPITNEEAEVLERFNESAEVSKIDFSPREQLLANQLVNKDILSRHNINGAIVFKKRIRGQ